MGAGLNKKAKERIVACKKDGGTDLNFSECSIQDFRNFGPVLELKKLVKLNLSRNYIAELPPQIDRLKQLEELDLSNNQLKDLNAAITAFVSLRRFSVSENQIPHLPSMGSFRSLTYLDISNNKITDLPGDILQTPLQHLLMNGLNLSAVPSVVWDFGGKLRSLHVRGNKIRDRLPESIMRLVNLELLDISSNEMTMFPPPVCLMTTLKKLYFSANLVEILPTEFTKLISLEVLDVSENRLVTLEKMSFRSLTSLVDINFAQNRLRLFARGLMYCKRLRSIDLSHNQLEKLPRDIGFLDASLRKLNCNTNKLLELPGELCFLTPSLDLNLDNNPLKYPFRENYVQGTPLLLDSLKPFCSAFPATSYAMGPQLNKTFAGNPTMFVVKSCDKVGDPLVKGGGTITAEIFDPREQKVVQEVVTHDEKDGTRRYKCFYNCTRAGKYVLNVLADGEPIKGSPYPLLVTPGVTSAANCLAVGEGLTKGNVGKPIQFLVQTVDKFGNKHTEGGDKVEVAIEGGSKPRAVVQDNNDGTYTAAWNAGWAGTYEINIKVGGVLLQGCPFFCTVS